MRNCRKLYRRGYTVSVTSSSDPENGFVQWLQEQLDARGWTAQEMAQRAGLAQATVSNVLNRKRSAGVEFVRAIADVLDVSQIDVFRIAGLIDEELLDDAKAAQEYLRLLAAIKDDDERQAAIDTVETVLRRVAERRKAAEAKPSGRPAVARGKA